MLLEDCEAVQVALAKIPQDVLLGTGTLALLMKAPFDGSGEVADFETVTLGLFVACTGRRATLRVGRALTNAETPTE